MAADTLRTALAAVPGVAFADVRRGDVDQPVGVTIRLQEDADPEHVGLAVQRLLAARGMRSRLAAPEASPGAVPTAATPRPPDRSQEDSGVVVPMKAEMPPSPEPILSPSTTGIRAVSVEERHDGLGVVVTLDDGRIGTRRNVDRRESLDRAVIAAVAEALGEPVREAVAEWSRFEADEVVTVVVRGARGASAGAAVAGVGRAYAVAVAARAALAE